MIWHIFYTKSTGVISWSTSADVNQDIKDNQKTNEGLDYIQIDSTDVPDANLYYVSGTTVAEKTTFNPTFSSDTWELDATVTVSGLPVGTEIILDDVSKGTTTGTTATLNINETGRYVLEFHKPDHVTYIYKKMVSKAT